MKATEQYFTVVLFIMLYKVVLTFESVKEILQCDHSLCSLFFSISQNENQDFLRILILTALDPSLVFLLSFLLS